MVSTRILWNASIFFEGDRVGGILEREDAFLGRIEQIEPFERQIAPRGQLRLPIQHVHRHGQFRRIAAEVNRLELRIHHRNMSIRPRSTFTFSTRLYSLPFRPNWSIPERVPRSMYDCAGV